MKCPICKKNIDDAAPNRSTWFPFCSQRCKLIDLGRWLGGKYQIVDSAPDQSEGWDDLPDGAADRASSDDASTR
jgi:endogenous inhibitor of DNA gyrase (YacG/DUF329 family)